MNGDKICSIIDLIRDDLLKGWQYACIFGTWWHERNKQDEKMKQWFTLYQKIFHSRRLFRLLQSIAYAPQMIKISNQLRQNFTFKGIFGLLGNIFIALFLLFDNITIIMMVLKNPSYRVVRRVSYTLLLIGIIWQIISIAIELRQSFSYESDLKKKLQQMTPTQFLEKLSQIDEKRKIIAIEFIQIVGDFFPTMARTNLPEIIVRTKINKGTVGFFGMIASLSSVALKMKRNEREIRQRSYV